MANGNILYKLLPLTGRDVVNHLESDAGDLPGSAANDKRLNEKISQLSNTNLVDNGDFRQVINQRGKTVYENMGKSRIFTVDRWSIYGAEDRSKQKLEVNDGYITFTAHKKWYSEFGQNIENFKCFDGKAMTLSCKLHNEERIYSASGCVNCSIDSVPIIATVGAYYRVEVRIIPSANIFAVRIRTINNDSLAGELEECSIDVEWVKLELGSLTTPFTPPDYDMEFMKCQRYYHNSNSLSCDKSFTENKSYYTKNADGTIILELKLNSNTEHASSFTIGTLPDGYRPARNIEAPLTFTSPNGSAVSYGHCCVFTNGNVQVYVEDSGKFYGIRGNVSYKVKNREGD